MAPKKTTLDEVGEMLTHVVQHMATKEDLQELRGQLLAVGTQVNSIEQQLREGRHEQRIGNLEEKVFGVARL